MKRVTELLREVQAALLNSAKLQPNHGRGQSKSLYTRHEQEKFQ